MDFILQQQKGRWELYEKNNSNHPYTVKILQSGVRITMDSFDKYWGDYKKLQHVLNEKTKKKYKKVLSSWYSRYNKLFSDIITFISEIDVYSSLAKASIKYAYSRPIIVEDNVLRAKKDTTSID